MSPTLSPIEYARAAIEKFILSSREPVFLEPGEEPVKLVEDNWVIEYRSGRLTFQAWDDKRNIVRRVISVAVEKPGRIELAVERFGKRAGSVLLLDCHLPRNVEGTLRAARLGFREHFRRALRRQFPEWRIVEMTTEADLQHSLSSSYPRALLRKGLSGWAAIGAPPEATDIAGIVTFGIIWLDYLRSRERRLTIEGLTLFLPSGRERVACLRLRYLDPRAAKLAVFIYTADGYEDPVDLADYGNLDTRLAPATRPSPVQAGRVSAWVKQIAGAVSGVEVVNRNDGGLSLRVRGLEFARATESELLYGLETRRAACPSALSEIETLAAELARMRSPDAGNRENPLYSRNPEGWLESQVRTHIEDIDASLQTAPIYGQVPAFTAGDRDVIDLLAADVSGRLTVVELKASEDLHLPMQALDYWMRVRWHAARGEFGPAGYFPGVQLRADPPKLLLIAPALAFHPSNEVVLRYFSSEIHVERIGVGLEWRKHLKVMFRY